MLKRNPSAVFHLGNHSIDSEYLTTVVMDQALKNAVHSVDDTHSRWIPIRQAPQLRPAYAMLREDFVPLRLTRRVLPSIRPPPQLLDISSRPSRVMKVGAMHVFRSLAIADGADVV